MRVRPDDAGVDERGTFARADMVGRLTHGAKAGERSTERRPLAPTLIGLALALWLIDLVFRRVRVFE